MKSAIALLLCLLPGSAAAQLIPHRHHVMAHAGPLLSTQKLLEQTAIYPTGRASDPFNPVETEISLDPGLFTGMRYVYSLTRRLAVEAELDFGLAVLAIRQLEIKPDAEPGDEPQFETTTIDGRIYQYSVNLAYYFGPWSSSHLYVLAGIGNHRLDLRKKGEVDADPVDDRMGIAGLGLLLHANERLGVRVELRDYIYSFSFDNQFVDPVASRQLLFRRPELYNTTSIAEPRLQHDLVLTLGFMVHPF